MAEPVRVDRPARNCHRTQPESATQTRRDRRVVFRLRDGVFVIDAVRCTVASWLCPLSLYMGDQYRHCICCCWCYLLWCHPLHFAYCRRCGFQELPIPNTWVSSPSQPKSESAFSRCLRSNRPNDCIRLAVYFVDAQDVVGQRCPPINLEIPQNDRGTHRC